MSGGNLMSENRLGIYPLTSERWPDFERLFGNDGAHGGCWCMWWRIPEDEFERQCGVTNKNAMQEIVNSGKQTGIIAYIDDQPIGWCSFGTREEFPSLHRYWNLDGDNKTTWSVVCFFIAKPYRRQGVKTQLLKYALEYAVHNGAKVVEGFPIEPKEELTSYSGFTGIESVYRKLGFTEVYRNSKGQLIMKYFV